MLGPHILGVHRVTRFISAAISLQPLRRVAFLMPTMPAMQAVARIPVGLLSYAPASEWLLCRPRFVQVRAECAPTVRQQPAAIIFS